MINEVPYMASFHELHTCMMTTSMHDLPSGSLDHDDFYCLLVIYKHNAAESARMDELAGVCERRIVRDKPPLDLVIAYQQLARLARRRAAQLRAAR